MLKREMAEKTTLPVGTYEPNKNGMFNMLGNVREWCTDNNDSLSNNPMPCTTHQGPLSARKKQSGAEVFSATQEAGPGVMTLPSVGA